MTLKVYNSHEEQEEEQRKYSASLSPEERLMHLRKLINLNYGIDENDETKLPKKRTIKIIEYREND